jgi:hypothetical protein
MRGWERRASALLALIVLTGGLATSGLCFMERAVRSGDEHSCCRSGVSAASPSCCMTAESREAPAKVAARFEVSAPTLVDLPAAARPVDVARVPWEVRATAWPPSSPPTRAVLRI